MGRWHCLEPVDASFFDAARLCYRYPMRLSVPPERVWESLASEGSVADWGLGLKSLRWTSPRPFGVGTTRDVVLPMSALTLREEFFRWDEGKGYSFGVSAADRPLFTRFAENYEIEPDGTGSLFTWTIAFELRHGTGLVSQLGPVNRLAFGQFERAAKRYFC